MNDVVAINKPDTPASLKMFLCLRFMLILAFESTFSFFSFFVSPPLEVMGMVSGRNLNAFHLTSHQLDKWLSSRGKSSYPEVRKRVCA